jgi:hypothetical protein
MPANIGDITTYHLEQAARHHALAQAARDRGCTAEAEYQEGLAARWEEVARQQKFGTRQLSNHHMARQRSIYPAPNTPPKPFSVISWMAVVRSLKSIAALFHPSMAKPRIPLHVVPPR